MAACERTEAVWQAAPSAAAEPMAARVDATCDLPVSFGLAESWKPKPVTIEADDPLAELARRGPLTMACEIDAKPAGNIGFLRVWTGATGDLRTVLTGFIGSAAQEPVFAELPIGGRPGLEVTYRQKSQLDDALDPEKAFIVTTGQGVAVVSLDSLDSEEHKAMLPAYELAKSSLTVTG